MSEEKIYDRATGKLLGGRAGGSKLKGIPMEKWIKDILMDKKT